MQIKEFLGSIVLDKNAYEVGKVANVEFNPETGKIETIILTLQKISFQVMNSKLAMMMLQQSVLT